MSAGTENGETHEWTPSGVDSSGMKNGPHMQKPLGIRTGDIPTWSSLCRRLTAPKVPVDLALA